MLRFLLVVSLLFLTCTTANEYDFKVNQLILAFEKLMNFFENDTSDPILDMSFGISLARGQLEEILANSENNFDTVSIIPSLKQLISSCNRFLTRSVISYSDEDNEFAKQVLLHDLRSPGSTTKRLRPLGKAPLKLMIENPDGYLVTPQLNEDQSDGCIFELYKKCNISKHCRYLEGLRPRVTGYSLTHRLLYSQFSRQMNCSWPKNKSGYIELFCRQILTESLAIAELDYPREYQDLFIEQLALCGIEGFREFVNLKWIDKILEWQTVEGCFSTKERVKRDDAVLIYGCSAHKSGVAAALFATLLRQVFYSLSV